MTPLDLGSWAAGALTGSMAGAIPVAVFAGLLSFFSPCVLPLIPGYLSYVTGLGPQTSLKDSVGHVLWWAQSFSWWVSPSSSSLLGRLLAPSARYSWAIVAPSRSSLER
ncbi:cytochrome C biogenesis membrane protein [Cutibacterium acnes HL005PA1]|nr:cytochrome C biogenesis membrane protein [Cutibacterium acnes HL005PA1]